MKTKNQASSHDLDTALSSMCYSVDRKEKDDISVGSSPGLLPPDSSVSLIIDIREIASKSSRALKSCSHSLRVFAYKNGQISLLCPVCPSSDSSEEETEVRLVEDREAPEIKDKNEEIQNSQKASETTDSDDEIDQLLMDSPEKEEKETSHSLDSPQSSIPRNISGLKLRPLSSLMEQTSSELPSFTSSSLVEGQHPMLNIPRYVADSSLTDETGQPHVARTSPLSVTRMSRPAVPPPPATLVPTVRWRIKLAGPSGASAPENYINPPTASHFQSYQQPTSTQQGRRSSAARAPVTSPRGGARGAVVRTKIVSRRPGTVIPGKQTVRS